MLQEIKILHNEAKKFFKKFKQIRIELPKVKSFILVLLVLVVVCLGFFIYFQAKELIMGLRFYQPAINLPAIVEEYKPQTTQEEAVIKVVKDASPAVVSVIISKEVPIYEQYVETQPFSDFFGGQFEIKVPRMRQKGTEKQVVGSGTGFIVSADGMIITNKHVVAEERAFFEIITWEGKKYPVEVLAKDPLQDLAILKIKIASSSQEVFPVVKLGNSNAVVVGQTVIAIGNALGEFSNSVSVGVISGLSRSISASDGKGFSEDLSDIFQTDAAINKGNSGGPLLNLMGEVIGINVAVAEGAQSIGFALPVNKAKRDIRQLNEQGKISYPFLGIRYVLINPDIQETQQLSVDYGALIIKGDTANEPAVEKNSAAFKAGLKENDIILEIDGVKITQKTPLSNIVQNQHIPGDTVNLKILRGKKEMDFSVVLGEKSSD